MVAHEAYISASGVAPIYHAAISDRETWDDSCSSALTEKWIEGTLLTDRIAMDIPVGLISATPKVAENTINTTTIPPTLELNLEHAPAVRSKYHMAHDTNFFHPNVDRFLPENEDQ